MVRLLEILLIGLFAIVVGVVASITPQETCPDNNGWVKINSNDMSLYPVEGAVEYCFKAGSDQSQGCVGGLFYEWPLPEDACGLSHWSYKLGDPTPTPTDAVPTPTDAVPTPTSTDEPTPTNTPTITPTPWPGTPTPFPTQPCTNPGGWADVMV
jgi:hypothetical protein